MLQKPLTDFKNTRAFSLDYGSQDIQLLTNLKALIEDHYKENRDPEFYSGLLSISLKRLNRLVDLYLGSTVYQLLQDRVHLEIIHLLKFTTLSSKQISFDLGICDPAYLSYCFKRITGLTPMAYRKQYQNLSFFKSQDMKTEIYGS
jgi:AraC-like DNA-binding protein